jgi:5-methylcytosine-specific restriction endonuclease McrA
LLSKNEVSLSIVSKLSIVLNEQNKDELLEEVRFQSARQVDAIIARYRPMSILRERARPVYVKTSLGIPVTEKDQAENSSSSLNKSGQKFTADVGGKKLDTCGREQKQDSVLVQKFKLEFAVNPDVMKKLEEVKSILSTKYPRGVSFEQIFEVMLDEYLENHSPKRKEQRRNKRIVGKKKSNGNKRSRHIPAAVQSQVFRQDKGRCTYKGSNGRRCNSTWNIQIDHIKPFAIGGTHSLQNLRLLCARHNQYESERIYGREFIKQRICKSGSKRE